MMAGNSVIISDRHLLQYLTIFMSSELILYPMLITAGLRTSFRRYMNRIGRINSSNIQYGNALFMIHVKL